MPVQIKRRGVSFSGAGDGVFVRYLKGEGERLTVEVQTPQRVGEFMEIMNRALSTWETPPEWALDLMDKLTGTPSPQKPQAGPPHPNN